MTETKTFANLSIYLFIFLLVVNVSCSNSSISLIAGQVLKVLSKLLSFVLCLIHLFHVRYNDKYTA